MISQLEVLLNQYITSYVTKHEEKIKPFTTQTEDSESESSEADDDD
jgi:hypothetical protein